jgi:primary-amine oxidase
MSYARYVAIFLAGAGAALLAAFLLTSPGNRLSGADEPPKTTAGSPYEVIQEFPSGEKAKKTAWKVRWGQAQSRGLFITGAWFRREPKGAWMKVLGDARLSDIFVPYHGSRYPGSEAHRFWDLSTYHYNLATATRADAGPRGELLGDPPLVVKEVRDRGLMWKDLFLKATRKATRRGEELLLWGTLKAGNYAYVMQYGFRDDGTITFRLGATGSNYPSAPLEPHVHNALWRIDIDLDEPKHNTVLLMRHKTPKPGGSKLQSEDVHEIFNGGKEGWADWDPKEFTMLRVINPRKLSPLGGNLAYDLMPMRSGTSRHYGGNYEDCTLHDFYVTRSPHADGRPDDEFDFRLLPAHYVNGESIEDTDVVLWYISSMHHEPRAEDGKLIKDKEGNYRWHGVTLLMWGGFDLVPSNLFDQTPFYPEAEQ